MVEHRLQVPEHLGRTECWNRPAENIVGVEGNAFAQTMRQLEHERGGVDRLVSNRALYEMAVARANKVFTRPAATSST